MYLTGIVSHYHVQILVKLIFLMKTQTQAENYLISSFTFKKLQLVVKISGGKWKMSKTVPVCSKHGNLNTTDNCLGT